MKTAIQELQGILEAKILPCNDDNSYVYGLNVAYTNIIKYMIPYLLKKEKEQIVHSGNTCAIKAILYKEKLDEMCENELIEEVTKNTITHGEDYYNQTFNQNK